MPAIVKRQYNPGLLTSIFLFVPVGVLSAWIVSRAADCHLQNHLLALGVAIAVHGFIIAHARRRMAHLLPPVSGLTRGQCPAMKHV